MKNIKSKPASFYLNRDMNTFNARGKLLNLKDLLAVLCIAPENTQPTILYKSVISNICAPLIDDIIRMLEVLEDD